MRQVKFGYGIHDQIKQWTVSSQQFHDITQVQEHLIFKLGPNQHKETVGPGQGNWKGYSLAGIHLVILIHIVGGNPLGAVAPTKTSQIVTTLPLKVGSF